MQGEASPDAAEGGAPMDELGDDVKTPKPMRTRVDRPKGGEKPAAVRAAAPKLKAEAEKTKGGAEVEAGDASRRTNGQAKKEAKPAGKVADSRQRQQREPVVKPARKETPAKPIFESDAFPSLGPASVPGDAKAAGSGWGAGPPRIQEAPPASEAKSAAAPGPAPTPLEPAPVPAPSAAKFPTAAAAAAALGAAPGAALPLPAAKPVTAAVVAAAGGRKTAVVRAASSRGGSRGGNLGGEGTKFGTRTKGTVLWFDDAKRFGFIKPDAGQLGKMRDIFVHMDALTAAGAAIAPRASAGKT